MVDDDLLAFDPRADGPRYALGNLLGKGGMGEVRECTDLRIGRTVAMKTMRVDARNVAPNARARFLHEACVQAQTEHPSIVPVYDVAIDGDGAPYFTMRRVEGKTLDAILRGLRAHDEAVVKEFTRHKLLTAFGSACLAVHYAHTRAVFHCDLKPANVMFGAFGELYVLDWGLATRAGGAGGTTSSEETISGTPGYVAPERLAGAPPDARTDIYALGALLYEIVTLQPMHEGKTPDEIYRSTIDGKVERPSLRALDRDVPPELEAVCAKATTRTAALRYASARELYDDVMSYLEGDRDLALRKAMSRELTSRASQLAEEAKLGEAGSSRIRSDALRTLGRALALDPDNADALRTLLGLWTDTPRETPPEAIEEMHATERNLDGPRARGGVAGLVLLALLFPIFCASIGIVNMRKFVLSSLAMIAVAGLGLLRVYRPRRDGFAPTYLPVGVAVGLSIMGACYHPLVLTPTFAIPFAVGYTLSMDEKRRYLPMIVSCVAILVPCVLEHVGVLAPSSTMVGELACVIPRTVRIPLQNGAAIALGNVICIVGSCYYAIRFRDILTETQRRVSVGTWQLRQLLPKEARPATVPPPAPRG